MFILDYMWSQLFIPSRTCIVCNKYAQEKGKPPICRQLFCEILTQKKVCIHKP